MEDESQQEIPSFFCKKGALALYNTFPLIVAGDERLRHVFPSKQRAVSQLLALLENDERIRRIIIFGSAVTRNCGIDSDIDVAIDADITSDEFLEIAHTIYIGVNSDVDVIHLNSTKSELLKNEINRKGVVLYEKL